jgi:hypothetical protein
MPVIHKSQSLADQVCRLKCNREQPCQNCTTRGEQSACKWRGSKIPGAGVLTTDPMQQRINRLESLVKNLMSQNQQPTPPEDREPPSPHPSLEEAGKGLANGDHGLKWPINTGTTVIAGSHSVYKASDNWSDVLQEVFDSHLRSHTMFLRRGNILVEVKLCFCTCLMRHRLAS